MDTLIFSLMVWIATLSGLVVPLRPPHVSFVTAEQMSDIQCDGQCDDTAPLALHLQGVIYLRKSWSFMSIKDISVLVHELTHYVDYMNEVPYECISQWEKHAYSVQRTYVESAGLNFYEITGLDVFTITALSVSACED